METEREQPAIEPDDAIPDEGVAPPEPPEPDEDHVVEEKQQEG